MAGLISARPSKSSARRRGVRVALAVLAVLGASVTFAPAVAQQRTELEARAAFDRWSVDFTYGDYAGQPNLGNLDRRQGILGTGSVKLTATWVLLGGRALRP